MFEKPISARIKNPQDFPCAEIEVWGEILYPEGTKFFVCVFPVGVFYGTPNYAGRFVDGPCKERYFICLPAEAVEFVVGVPAS
ncbi:hypothetical protein C4553_03675 [Candidatus Parcubacteria bacterium]|nr:MAG: hypothetical protein C4553_03675 [Candidatus Parcubacteria bacterium]